MQLDQHLAKSTEPRAREAAGTKPLELHVNDGERTWTVSLPAGAQAYELVIPTRPEAPIPAPTSTAAGPVTPSPPAAPPRPEDGDLAAYLRLVAQVRQLRGAGQLELALLHTMKLSQRYPKRARVWAMLGTLHHELGQPEEARRAWQKALALDPSDRVTARALERSEK